MLKSQRSSELGTDVLSRSFGEGVKPVIIHQSQTERIVLTVTQKSNKLAAYCIVKFNDAARIFSEAHKEIVEGALIGETFRKKRISFERDENCVFTWICPPILSKLFGTENKTCLVKQVEFLVGADRDQYASIIEVYSPLVPLPELFSPNERLIRPVVDDLNKSLSPSQPYIQKLEKTWELRQ